ncbi:DNA polymerase exonuclease subunit [Gordonia phage Schnabeltier]|uniref:DnaQ-like exonuclease n=1 Tax=Gordonia phage Schnabeltier TaxID=1821561 RepID=A0A142KA50_9CAUD|nr:DNA polymerase exonuclease subunit [Gordonia phage Schnabeltier]AMS02983.1 DnaQ-like exonuclease [Gordonia phage Schnabeltier]
MIAASRMITGAVAFVDTETTGLGPLDEIWEFAAIIRRLDGSESTVHLHVEHDRDRAAALPERFLRDYRDRFGRDGMYPYSRARAASIISAALDGVHIVGVNPAFDARLLKDLLADAGLVPTWNYHLVDLSPITIGVLLAAGERVDLPWKSDALSARVGVPTADEAGEPLYARHTAMGDVLWARDWFDALSPPQPSEGTATTYRCRDCGGQWTWRNTPDGARGLAETQALHGGQLHPIEGDQ